MILGNPTQVRFDNPTQVLTGRSGEFFGRTYQVIGRALLGEMDFGRIYYWNEYYLLIPGEEIVTLVYEETALGGEWRWFTMFDPEHPLTAGEAATKKVGSTVDLDGVAARVSLVRESEVYHTEGRTPEGVRPGARANYFNAEAGSKLLVVSWTGTEMEFYRGTNLSRSAVAAAFKLRAADLVKFRVSPVHNKAPVIWMAVCAGLAAMALVFILSNGAAPTAPPSAMVRYKFPAPPLATGSVGSLNGSSYRVAGHAEVELAEVGRFLIRHEYYLKDHDGKDALLIFGWQPGTNEWLLFTSLSQAVPLSPAQAGNVRRGQTVNVDGVTVPVDELFRSTVVRSENLNEPVTQAGDVRYGFSGRAGAVYVLAVWSESGIVVRKGKLIQEGDITGPFTPSAER